MEPRPNRYVSDAFMGSETSSFVEFLTSCSPDTILRGHDTGAATAVSQIPHATTILAVIYRHGVVLAADRRATMGSSIVKRDVEKIFRADDFSGLGFAGAMGIGLEFARLFQVELEHYEKLEGRLLSLDGKARRLATIIRANMAAAFQGLAAVPVFAGYDEDKGAGRIFSFDITGGMTEERDYYGVGSGSVPARNSLKKLYAAGLGQDDALRATVEALYDAAEDDAATGGPDLTRQIFPSVALITADGFNKLADAEVATLAEAVVLTRRDAPNGPIASLR